MFVCVCVKEKGNYRGSQHEGEIGGGERGVGRGRGKEGMRKNKLLRKAAKQMTYL